MFSFHKKAPETLKGFSYIIAGLGNPGQQYEGTRHNAGFMALDAIAGHFGVQVKKLKFKALCGEAEIAGKRVLLLKPQTYMNLSGESVRDAAEFYKIPMENVLVIFDDISLPPGKMRIRRKGTDGGHNGIKNIIYLTGHDDFPRIKIGVGAKPRPDYDLAAWVLSRFTKEETTALNECLEKVSGAAEDIVGNKIDQAMNKFNS